MGSRLQDSFEPIRDRPDLEVRLRVCACGTSGRLSPGGIVHQRAPGPREPARVAGLGHLAGLGLGDRAGSLVHGGDGGQDSRPARPGTSAPSTAPKPGIRLKQRDEDVGGGQDLRQPLDRLERQQHEVRSRAPRRSKLLDPGSLGYDDDPGIRPRVRQGNEQAGIVLSPEGPGVEEDRQPVEAVDLRPAGSTSALA